MHFTKIWYSFLDVKCTLQTQNDLYDQVKVYLNQVFQI